jgi:enoyl-[acyl-carrier protein] reductase I
MISIDLSGKVALVTGVANNESFAWYIAKALQAAGARLVFSVHPRLMNIAETILRSERADDVQSRVLPHGAGTLKPERLIPCDVAFDTMDDVDEETRNNRRYAKHGDFSIRGMMEILSKEFGGVDILIHSVAFSPEIKDHSALETTRKGYWTSLSVSSYSLTALLRKAQPLMENRPGGASVVGLTYVGGERVIPHYAGGMGTAKAALQFDAKQLAWNVGPKNIRVNLISAGPYPSLAAKAIRSDFDKMVEHAAQHSPLQRPIKPEEVGDATVFLCSDLASAITGQILYVDCGYNIMGV